MIAMHEASNDLEGFIEDEHSVENESSVGDQVSFEKLFVENEDFAEDEIFTEILAEDAGFAEIEIFPDVFVEDEGSAENMDSVGDYNWLTDSLHWVDWSRAWEEGYLIKDWDVILLFSVFAELLKPCSGRDGNDWLKMTMTIIPISLLPIIWLWDPIRRLRDLS